MKDRLHTIIVPIYNSRGILQALVERVLKAMEGARVNFELVLVDDGSVDGSFKEIQRLSRLHPFIRGFRLSRNFGHQAALVIFLRGIRSWVGFKQIGVEYERASTVQEKSRYTLKKYFGFALGGILSFSYIPLRFATYLGITAAFLGFAFAVLVVFLKLTHEFEVSGYTSLIVVITFLGGIQLIAIGIIGEYLSRLNDNARKWPIAVVAEKTSGGS